MSYWDDMKCQQVISLYTFAKTTLLDNHGLSKGKEKILHAEGE